MPRSESRHPGISDTDGKDRFITTMSDTLQETKRKGGSVRRYLLCKGPKILFLEAYDCETRTRRKKMWGGGELQISFIVFNGEAARFLFGMTL